MNQICGSPEPRPGNHTKIVSYSSGFAFTAVLRAFGALRPFLPPSVIPGFRKWIPIFVCDKCSMPVSDGGVDCTCPILPCMALAGQFLWHCHLLMDSRGFSGIYRLGSLMKTAVNVSPRQTTYNRNLQCPASQQVIYDVALCRSCS